MLFFGSRLGDSLLISYSKKQEEKKDAEIERPGKRAKIEQV
jgi:hypothetical protein